MTRTAAAVVIAALATATLLAAMPRAHASATLTCEIADANLAADVMLHMSRDGDSFAGGLQGELTVKNTLIAPAGTRLELTSEHLAQHWHLDRDLRLAFRLPDVEPGRLRTLYILATQNDRGRSEGRFRGAYLLRTSGGGEVKDFRGRIRNCVSD